MNGKRRTIVVSAFAASALLVATAWTVFAGDGWPPEPYRVYSAAGAWTETSDLDQPGDLTIVTISPEDPRTGTGFIVATNINIDPTLGGTIPDATSWTSAFGTYVYTGPNTDRCKAVCYVTKDEKPKPVILAIGVLENASTQTSPDTIESVGTLSLYSPASDKDADGLPDAGEQPLMALPFTQHMKRI
jgi:hypothetical protein